MSVLGGVYRRREGDLTRVLQRLTSLLRDVEARIEDKTLVRARLLAYRVKSLESLQRKARKNKWKGEDAFAHCPDLIGARVVCNNLEDVYRFAELLRERLPWDSRFEIQDYIKTPNSHGYRSLHINFMLDATDTFVPDRVGCEVQIRTRLQDAWGELTHGDIYKQDDVPEDLREQALHLADLLVTADKMASTIRRRAVQVVSPGERPDLSAISLDALAFLFRERFGRSAPDYAMRQALNACQDLGVSSLEGFQALLHQDDLRRKFDKAYRSIMPTLLSPEDVFLTMLRAFARGDRDAVNYVRRKARREFREIDAVYRRELLSSLPESADEFLAELESHDGEPSVQGWAEVLDAGMGSCRVCGTRILDAEGFAEAVVQHYKPSQSDKVYERVVAALYDSGVECGGWDDASLCSYHEYQADKD
ncbi:MAG: hypothetical protein WC100_17830 [Sterolibacterium sp.]